MTSKLHKWWNVLTNLAYPVAAVITILLLGDDGPIAVGFVMIMMGLGTSSGIFHANILKYPLGNHLDVGAMYVLGIFLLVLGMSPRVVQIVDPWPILALASVMSVLGVAWLRFKLTHIKMEYKIPSLYAAIIVGGVIRHFVFDVSINWQFVIVALPFFATAGAFRFLLPETKYPWSHGIWHILSSPGLCCLYAAVRIVL